MRKGLYINPLARRSDGRRHIPDLLLDKLHTERRFLGMPYFTWWFEYGALEVFEPLTGIVPRSMWGEWERFVGDGSPELIAAIQEHDDAVQGLRDACAALQSRLESSAALHALYREVTRPEVLAALGTDLKTLFGARPPEHHVSYLAQLVVNGTPPDCSPLYTIRPLWLRFGEEFLALRGEEEFRPQVAALEKAAARLDAALGRLERLCSPATGTTHERFS